MEAKAQDWKQKFGADWRYSWSPRRERPVAGEGFLIPSVEGKAASRNSPRAYRTQAIRREFYLTVLPSRNTRKYMKTKSRRHVYPSQNWEGCLWLLPNLVLAQN